MRGSISLKEFILGVKDELREASKEGAKNPYLELTQVELEAEFKLDATASAEGGFKFLVKVGGETTAKQAHKVKLIFFAYSGQSLLSTTTISIKGNARRDHCRVQIKYGSNYKG